MPNWCYTDYVIEGSNEDLKCIEKAVCDVLDGKFPKQERSAQEWVGNVLHALRIPTERKDGQSLGYFRAFIAARPSWIDDNALRLHTNEAWGRTLFAEALRIRFKEISVYWSLKEEFYQILETNDFEAKYFNERFCVEMCIDGNYSSGAFHSKDDAWDFASKVSGCNNSDDALTFNDEHGTGEYVYVFEYDVVNDDFEFDDDIELLEEPDRNLF